MAKGKVKKGKGKNKRKGKKRMKKQLRDFNKYDYYIQSVQAPEADIEFFDQAWKDLRKNPKDFVTLREDFCGTFLVCGEWVKSRKDRVAYGLDLDPEPLNYGEAHTLAKLNDDQKERLNCLQMNVLSPEAPKAQMVVANNFSYFIFKEREQLKEYFTSVHGKLTDDGLFVVDIFGGSQCHEPNEEETEHDGFSYFWDQDYFDPVTNHALFYIHFKRDGEKKREKVFTYDWRMWTIPELRELLRDRRLTINQVAQLSGFDEYQSFYRFFTSATGMNPTAYREQQIADP